MPRKNAPNSTFFQKFFPRAKAPARTYQEFVEDEIENEALNHHDALAGTFIECVIGALGIFMLWVLVPGIVDFVAAQFQNETTKVVCWVILSMFGIGFYFVGRSLAIVNYEYANLMDIFRRSREMSAKNKKSIHFSELLPSAQYGIVYDKLDAIFRIAEEKGEVPHDSMADILMTKYATMDEIPNFLANSMTMVGLIGTIIGLTGATEGMETLFNSIGDLQSLKDGFQDTLSGINVAFFTTLFGASSMLVLKYFNIVARKARMVFLTELEQVMLTEILPKLPLVRFTEKPSSKRR